MQVPLRMRYLVFSRTSLGIAPIMFCNEFRFTAGHNGLGGFSRSSPQIVPLGSNFPFIAYLQSMCIGLMATAQQCISFL